MNSKPLTVPTAGESIRVEPMKHLEAFSKIGPRPTCGAKEREGAQFVKGFFEGLGLETQEDRFACNPSMFRQHISVFLFVVAMGVLPVLLPFYQVGYLLAAFGCLFARKVYMDLLHNKETVVGSFLPKQATRNVIAKIRPKGPVKNRIVLLSHLDSALCSPIFSEKMVRSLKTNIKLDLILFYVLGGLYAAAALTTYQVFYYGALALSLYVLGSLVVLLYSEMFSPISPGVNDNGSGVAAVMGFAEALAKNPLQNSEVWCVSLGAEEPGAYGSKALYEHHAQALKESYVINLDSIAVGNPRYLVNEGYKEEYACDPEMISILVNLRQERPDLQLTPMEFKGWGGYTDCTNLLQRGCKAITLVASETDGLIKNWHTLRDRMDNIQPETYSRTVEVAKHLILALDRKFS